MLQQIAARVMGLLGKAGALASANYSYEQLAEQIAKISDAIEEAIAADDAQANSFWTRFSQLVENNFNYWSERRRFEADAAALKLSALQAGIQVSSQLMGALSPTAPVPGQLESDAASWNDQARRVSDAKRRVGALYPIPGWEGDSSTQYDKAAKVQENALEELQTVMIQAAQGAADSATLHRGLFYIVATEVNKTVNEIRSAPAGTGDQYYMRTAAVRSICLKLLLTLVANILGKEALGAAQGLTAEYEAALQAVGLQLGDWPSGT